MKVDMDIGEMEKKLKDLFDTMMETFNRQIAQAMQDGQNIRKLAIE